VGKSDLSPASPCVGVPQSKVQAPSRVHFGITWDDAGVLMSLDRNEETPNADCHLRLAPHIDAKLRAKSAALGLTPTQTIRFLIQTASAEGATA